MQALIPPASAIHPRLRALFGVLACTASFVGLPAQAATDAPQTERMMLTGSGPDDAVPWDFKIDGGQKAGVATQIPVPSNWQQQGFGHYQYGFDKGSRSSDHAVYHRSFTVPANWDGKTVRILFDGVMTDALVKLNGTQVGPIHQGGFNRFSYDITALLRKGQANDLVVEVSEASAAKATDIAERHGDFWGFGGIFRPVWLEAAPVQSIGQVAVDAKANGDFRANVSLVSPRTVTRVVGQILDKDGKPVGAPFDAGILSGGEGQVHVATHIAAPALWSAETPNLYTVQLELFEGDKLVHRTTRRFGFRTFEVRDGTGLFLNGQRIMLKGVNRHSFTPETGRAISRTQAYADVREIRSMNMNAVRMSHYDPEEPFLEAADELGLYVVDELSGWQHAHDTEVGRKLVRELVERDVDHPSILFWTNGNEGGWNRELDGEFALYDPQHRRVLHPWEKYDGVDTKHYPRYPDLLKRLSGDTLVMPTEFLHGLFDGGAGSGLDDYWRAMLASPRGAGGFIWNFADEGVMRTDQGNRIDTYGTFAPDGIVGPHHEHEASFDTIREIWSPLQIVAPSLTARFDGRLHLSNAYDFIPLDQIRFHWAWLRFPTQQAAGALSRTIASGDVQGPALAPHASGDLVLPLPTGWQGADALELTASRGQEEVMRWVWDRPAAAVNRDAAPRGGVLPTVSRQNGTIVLQAGSMRVSFDAAGHLQSLQGKGGKAITLQPRLVVARPKTGTTNWLKASPQANGVYVLSQPMLANAARIDLGMGEGDGWGGFRLEVSGDLEHWDPVYENARASRDGLDYGFAPRLLRGIRISHLAGVRATPSVHSVEIASEPERYALPVSGDQPASQASTGTGTDSQTGLPSAWVDVGPGEGFDHMRWTLGADGALWLDYRYSLNGRFLYHGVGFDAPSMALRSVRARIRGPKAVWQNRLRGPLPGVYVIAETASKSLPSPDQAGYFADPRWVTLSGENGKLEIVSEGSKFLQLGARWADHPTTTVEFPSSTFGFMDAIPAMGAKSQAADLTGPQGQPNEANGQVKGQLVFHLKP